MSQLTPHRFSFVLFSSKTLENFCLKLAITATMTGAIAIVDSLWNTSTYAVALELNKSVVSASAADLGESLEVGCLTSVVNSPRESCPIYWTNILPPPPSLREESVNLETVPAPPPVSDPTETTSIPSDNIGGGPEPNPVSRTGFVGKIRLLPTDLTPPCHRENQLMLICVPINP